MGDLLTNLVEWMGALPILWAYVLILSVAFAENIIPPIPGDMFVVFGGYMVGIGSLDITSVIVLATAGGAIGFMAMYAFGRRLGHVVFVPKKYQWLSEARIKTVKKLLGRWGFGLVVANRFLSGLRSVISVTVGMVHMRPWETAFFATISALIWTTVLAIVGYFLGENWAVVSVYLRNYGWIITGGIAFFGILHVIRLRLRHLRLDAEARAESESASLDAQAQEVLSGESEALRADS